MTTPNDARPARRVPSNPPDPASAAWAALAGRIDQITTELHMQAAFRPWESAAVDVTERERLLNALGDLAATATSLRRVIAEVA